MSLLTLFRGGTAGTAYTLTGLAGSYTLSGGTASLKVNRKITANAGTYSLTGGSASLEVNRNITANAGSYSITGGMAAIHVARKLTALSGAYGLSGGAATLKTGRTLTALAGSYTLTGASATLTKSTGGNNYTLTAGSGVYALTGGDAELTLTAAPSNRGGFEMGGRRVYLKRGKKIHIFDTVEEADAWEHAEQLAFQAIAKAQKPSRQAKKRAIRKVNASIAHETINLVALERLVQHFGIPVELPTLEAQQDWLEVARISLLAHQMQDDEDVEMLLMV